MDLAQIRISETQYEQIIVLRERNGPRLLYIRIGLPEALAIDRRVKGESPERPYTHDLLANVLHQLTAEVEKVVVSDLRKGTYYAKLVLRHGGELVEIDSRPSDAIALGVATDVPLYVEDHVLREAAQ